MAVRFDCSHCKATYEVADDLAGKMIMCRVCQKRAAVRSLGTASSSSLLKATTSSPASSVDKSRRNFLIAMSVASLSAIGAGAMLARRPWRRWGNKPAQSSAPEGTPPDRPRRRPPDAKGDNKGGA